MSALSAFTAHLVAFFDELCATFPEEKELHMATEAIKGAKKINPRLVLDLFITHVYNDCSTAILNRDAHLFRSIAQAKIANQFNEMLSALSMFDKHWDTMGTQNQEVIWQYLKVLSILSEKARSS